MTELRPITKADLPTIVRWRNDPVVSCWLSPLIKTLPDVERWFAAASSKPDNRYFGIYNRDRLIGYCGIRDVDMRNRRGEIGLVIGESTLWGQGIGRTVVMEMLRRCFEELHLHRVAASIVRGNDRSTRLFESLGFRHEGTHRESLKLNGDYGDMLLYSILEGEYRHK